MSDSASQHSTTRHTALFSYEGCAGKQGDGDDVYTPIDCDELHHEPATPQRPDVRVLIREGTSKEDALRLLDKIRRAVEQWPHGDPGVGTCWRRNRFDRRIWDAVCGVASTEDIAALAEEEAATWDDHTELLRDWENELVTELEEAGDISTSVGGSNHPR